MAFVSTRPTWALQGPVLDVLVLGPLAHVRAVAGPLAEVLWDVGDGAEKSVRGLRHNVT